MDELKATISKNLVELRNQAHLTQLQLAEKLNYSDKAVSKWERGEAIPDVRVLVKIAEIYNISLDDIITPEASGKRVRPKLNTGKRRILISVLSAGLAAFVMTLVFMIFYFVPDTESYAYLAFVCLPLAVAIPLMVFSALWGNWITNTIASSLIVWSVAIIIHLFVNAFTGFTKIYFIYIVAGVFQLLVICWFVLRKIIKRKKENKE